MAELLLEEILLFAHLDDCALYDIGIMTLGFGEKRLPVRDISAQLREIWNLLYVALCYCDFGAENGCARIFIYKIIDFIAVLKRFR